MNTETKYTAEQYERMSDDCWSAFIDALSQEGHRELIDMLRQAAQMMREREVGGAVTNEDVRVALGEWYEWNGTDQSDDAQHAVSMRAALESFAARRAVVMDVTDYALAKAAVPSKYWDRVREAIALSVAAPEVPK